MTKDINSLKTRYSLAPQMMEYDKIGRTWLPYLMYFHAPNYSSDILNTDSRGFRVGYSGSRRISGFENIDERPISLVVGSSAAFGVGATSDKNTISSILSEDTDCLWLNFGGRAFNSTQELLLFLFFHRYIKNIKRVVILSGLNNLMIYHSSAKYSKELGSFFSWSQYNSIMNIEQESLGQKIASRVLRPVFGNRAAQRDLLKFDFGKEEKETQANFCLSSLFKTVRDHNKEKDDLLCVLKRDISIWKLITDALQIKLYYVLQPTANWVRRELAAEETALFDELDNHPTHNPLSIKDVLNNSLYDWFLKNLSEICNFYDVRFLDMNEAISKKALDEKWLYVDRIHLTDEGYRISADILKDTIW